MFGYLDIQKDKIKDEQRGLWQTFMCGLCFSTKKLIGNIPRMFITNDINFFNVLFHSVLELDVEIENKNCFTHPFKKRTVIQLNDLTDRLAIANVVMTYWNLYDDVVDGNSRKRALAKIFQKYHKKARMLCDELDQMVELRYNQLRELEKGNYSSIDMVAHSFAQLSQDFCKIILGEKSNEFCETLCYNLGKWIYLIDALDDAKKDLKKGNYNPFVKSYDATKISQLTTHHEEISFVMYAVLNRIAQSFNDMNLQKYNCILKNVLYDSIRDKTQQVIDNLAKQGKKQKKSLQKD